MSVVSSDRRQGSCFRQLVGGKCVTRESSAVTQATKADCCCTLGVAWGARCERCPQAGTSAYSELCLEAGYSVNGADLDECSIILDLCKFGTCINTLGSYRCICNKGFKVDPSGTHCIGEFNLFNKLTVYLRFKNWFFFIYIDVNECESVSPKVCQHTCENTVGSFICTCPNGYTLSSDGINCKDQGT